MTVNSTLGHISKDIVWVYTLLEHYTVILSLWVGGFTRINTICLVKKNLQMSLFPLFFFLFCRKTTYTSPEWRRLRSEKFVQRQSQTNKMNIYFFLGDSYFSSPRPKWKTSRVKRCVGPFSVWQNLQKNFVSFFLWEISEQPSMNDELRRRLCLAGWFFSLLLLAFIPLGVTIHTSESKITF